MATHCSPCAWKIPWTEEPGRLYSPWDSKESHMSEQLHFLQKVSCMHCHTQGSQLCRGPQLIHTSSRDSWTLTGKSGSVSVGPQLLSSGSWCTQGFVCALQESVSPVLCKFWRLCGGVNGNLLQEGLCHTQVSCTQSPCPCRSHSKMVGGVKSCLESNPIAARDTQRSQTYLVCPRTQRPHREMLSVCIDLSTRITAEIKGRSDAGHKILLE